MRHTHYINVREEAPYVESHHSRGAQITTGRPGRPVPIHSPKQLLHSTRYPLRPTGAAEPGRPGELRRIVGLFSGHRGRLTFVAALIVASALISVASPFLLREMLDVSLPTRDTVLTALLAGGMVAIAVSTTALDVVQSRQSTIVGQSVMHRLRTSVYTHLQRLSLGFYTRTEPARSNPGSPVTSARCRPP